VHTSPASRPFRLLTTGKRAAVALLSLALVAGGVLVATPASAAETGRISGVVTSLQTGEDLEGITVSLLPEFDALSEWDDAIAEDETDAAGQYSFARVPAGNYRLLFEHYAFDWDEETGEPIYEGEQYLSQFHGGQPGDYSGDVAPIQVDSSSIAVNQQLGIAGSYTGTVLTNTGKPAVGVTVYAISTTGNYFSVGGDAETAKDGSYTITDLPYGDYDVYTLATSKAPTTVTTPAPISATAIQVAVPSITLSLGSFITGRVLSPEGKPLRDIELSVEQVSGATDALGGMNAGGTSNARGEYSVGPLLPGTFALYAFQQESSLYNSRQFLGGSPDIHLARTITITKPGSTIGREFRFAKRATLTGTVRADNGSVAKNIDVMALQLDGTGGIFNFDSSQGLATTNAKGQYSIEGLNPGSYLAGFGVGTTAAGSPVSKEIALPTGVTKLNATLGAETTISGLAKTSAGTALKGIRVEAVAVGNENQCVEGSLISYFGNEPELTTATGAYSLSVPAGDWALRFVDPSGRVATSYLGGGDHPTASATTVISTNDDSADLSNQNATLPLTGITVSADVTSSTGVDDFDTTVSLERLIDGDVVDGPGFGQCLDGYYFTESAPANEYFPLRHVTDGDYRLTVTPQFWQGNYDVEGLAVDFTVADGAVSTVDGEPAADGTTLGSLVLPAPTPAITPPDIEKPTIFAPDGAVVGATLSAVVAYPDLDEDWSAYQWYRNGRPIAGAYSPNYVVQSGDVGSVLAFEFAGYALDTETDLGPVMSVPTAVVQDAEIPVPADAPTITGSGRVGGTLTAVPAPGDPAGTTYGYQWNINGQALTAATTTTFTPRIQDLGETISVTVTETLPGADVTTGATSAGTVIGKGKAIVLSKPVLLVNGKASTKLRLGSTLTASIKGMPKDSLGASFQWQIHKGKSWSNLAGATTSTLTLSKKKSTTTNVGYTYRLVVEVERSGYEDSTPVTSNALKAHKK